MYMIPYLKNNQSKKRWVKGKQRSKRKRDRERICDLYKQQAFIRERKPERDPQPLELHSERGESTPVLQAGVFKHPVVGKGGWRGWALEKMTAKGDWGKVLDITGKVTGAG
jgi:hypothetical protein